MIVITINGSEIPILKVAFKLQSSRVIEKCSKIQ